MGLETATFISGLNANNPVGAIDPKSQGDDHLRLIKSTLLNTFPNITGAMNASHGELNNLVGATGKTGTGNLVHSASPTFTGTLNAAAISFSGTLVGSGASLTALNASSLASGTVPDARFPATLPAASGVNLTSLNASNLASGTVPNARFPAALPAVSGANLTSLNGSNISTGTVADARIASSIARLASPSFSGTITSGGNISMTGTRLIDATTKLSLTGATVILGETGGNAGFYGTAGIARPTITGAKTDLGFGGALDVLLTNLASMGLIINSTS